MQSSIVTLLNRFAKSYEAKRKPSTSLLRAKSSVLGYVETLGTPVGVVAKESLFKFANFAGIAKKVFISAASPNI
jgi:hypothetical protein